MTSVARRRENFSTKLDLHDCRRLLAEESIGRIGWAAGSGQLIVPITYVYADPIIGFRTATHGRLTELIRPTQVAFEVDRLDRVHNEGVSVVIQGVTRAAQTDGRDPDWADLVVPWAGGQRPIAIEISISKITGRRIRRHAAAF